MVEQPSLLMQEMMWATRQPYFQEVLAIYNERWGNRVEPEVLRIFAFVSSVSTVHFILNRLLTNTHVSIAA